MPHSHMHICHYTLRLHAIYYIIFFNNHHLVNINLQNLIQCNFYSCDMHALRLGYTIIFHAYQNVIYIWPLLLLTIKCYMKFVAFVQHKYESFRLFRPFFVVRARSRALSFQPCCPACVPDFFVRSPTPSNRNGILSSVPLVGKFPRSPACTLCSLLGFGKCFLRVSTAEQRSAMSFAVCHCTISIGLHLAIKSVK